MDKQVIPYMSAGYAYIALGRGYWTLVDSDNIEALSVYRWRANVNRPTVYAVAKVGAIKTGLHRIVTAAAPGQYVDHINGNGLDNRRANLRLCTQEQNRWNMPQRSKKSKYKGVMPHPNGKWSAYSRGRGSYRYLGMFPTEEAAALAFDEAALQHFGEFARLNFPRELEAEVKEGK